MELKIQHVEGDNFTVQDQHDCYLDQDGEQVMEPCYLKPYEVVAVVEKHTEAAAS